MSLYEDITLNFKDKLSILSLNIRSCPHNFNYLESLLSSLKFQVDIIVLIETWLSDDIRNLYDIEGYKHVSVNRNRNGGGIRCYINENLQFSVMDDFTGIFNTHESLFMKIKTNYSRDVILGSIYRPPSLVINEFNNYLSALLNHKDIENQDCILLGDFNIDLNKIKTIKSYAKFNDTLLEYGFTSYINEPTHISNSTHKPESILDHIWCNFNRECIANIIEHTFTDHLPIILGIKRGVKTEMVKQSFRDFSRGNIDRFLFR